MTVYHLYVKTIRMSYMINSHTVISNHINLTCFSYQITFLSDTWPPFYTLPTPIIYVLKKHFDPFSSELQLSHSDSQNIISWTPKKLDVVSDSSSPSPPLLDRCIAGGPYVWTICCEVCLCVCACSILKKQVLGENVCKLESMVLHVVILWFVEGEKNWGDNAFL